MASAQQPAVRLTGPRYQPPLARRPFDHDRHHRVSCRECHGTGAAHRTMLVRTARDCASCHHDPRRAMECASCHTRERLPEQLLVPATMRLPPSGNVRTRELPFRHEIHLAAGRTCGDCHRTDVTLQVDRECASCHASHHTATSECATCHVPAKAGVHNADVHLSCAGSGCHASAAAPSPALSRNLCLACHAAQKTHEPGGVCAECHRIPATHLSAPSASRGGPGMKGRP